MATTNHSLPSESDFARLEGELFARIDRRHRGQVLRHRLVAIAIVAVVAGTGVAAGTVASTVQQQVTASCYSAASTSSPAQTSLFAVPHHAARPSAATVARAVGQCAALWQAGVIGPGGTTPRLQACLGDNLVIGVFPRRHQSGSVQAFCENLGMSKP